MKRWIVLVLALFVFSLIPFTKSVSAADPWASAYASWQYRTAVTISNSGSSDLTDFQVKVVLDSNWPGWAHVKEDGGDIRFADAAGNPIPYDLTHTGEWDYVNHRATIWIKVPSIPAGGSTTIYIYYGNPSATDASDPSSVFDFYDGFDTLDSTKWTAVTGTWAVSDGKLYVSSSYGQYPGNIIRSSYQLSSDVVVEMKATIPEVSSGNTDVSLATCPSSGYVGTEIIGPVNLGPSTSSYYAWGQADSSAWTWETGSDSNVQMGQTYTYQMNYVSGTATLKILETGTSYSHALTSNYLGIHIGATIGTGFGIDWIRVRKYSPTEPTVSVSTTEEVNSGGYTVTLSLKDDAGNSLSDVSITVKDSTGNVVLSGTYGDGDSFTLLSTGDYTIEASKDGYLPASASLSIVEGTTDYTVSITLPLNHPPTAPTSLTFSSGLHVGKETTFTASGATDPDGDTIQYEYKFEDLTTGALIQDWSPTNSFTPSSSQLYHTIQVYARAVDSHGATSDAVSRVLFVLPAESIADVPFNPDSVKSKVVFILSTAFSDVPGITVKTDGQTSGSGALFLLASFGGVHWWVNASGNTITLYSDSQYGFLISPILTDTEIGSNKWARDYVQQFIDFASTSGSLEGTLISPGTYIQTYTAYVSGINTQEVAWMKWVRYSYTGSWSGKYIKWTLTLPPKSSLLTSTMYEYYITTNSDTSSLLLDIYDSDESAGASPETSVSVGANQVRAALSSAGLTSLDAWLVNRSFNFYMYARNGFDNHLVGAVRLVGIADTNVTLPVGSFSVSGPTYSYDTLTIPVQPLPRPTTITFWFYDENHNPLNGVEVYTSDTYLGTFNSGDSITLDYAGTYTFTAKKLHYVDTTVTTYVEGNAGVSFVLQLETYNVTIRIVDEKGNLLSATLYVDNTNRGLVQGETSLLIAYGSHTFRAVDSEGYSGETTALVDHDGRVVTITIEHPVTVTFKIYDSNSSAELTGVTLYVDGASYGLINSGDQLQFQRGLHSFKFEKDGYLATTLTIDLQADTTLTIFLIAGNVSEEGLGSWPGMNLSQWGITPINSYAKAFIDSGGMFGDTIKNAIRADPLMKLLLPQLLILAIVIFILVQTQSPIAGIGGALIMQAMFSAILGEAPNLRNSSLTFMLIVFLTAWTMWDLFVNYSRET